MVFATVTDLEARWRALTGTERTQAETLLADASAFVAVELQRAGRSPTDPLVAPLLVGVVCAMVKRSMQASQTAAGVTQYTQSATPYSESFTYANPTGELFMTRAEKKLLGIGGQRIRSLAPTNSYQARRCDDLWRDCVRNLERPQPSG